MKKGETFEYKGVSYLCHKIEDGLIHASKVINGRAQRGRPSKFPVGAFNIQEEVKIKAVNANKPLTPKQKLKRQKAILSVFKFTRSLNPGVATEAKEWVK